MKRRSEVDQATPEAGSEALNLVARLDDLDEGLRIVFLLSDARIALDAEHPLDALGAMQKHERLFPNSAFTEERLAIQVMATCLMGQREAAQPFFERLLQRDPETTYYLRRVGGFNEGTVRVELSASGARAVLVATDGLEASWSLELFDGQRVMRNSAFDVWTFVAVP